jgi:hypothetical protein
MERLLVLENDPVVTAEASQHLKAAKTKVWESLNTSCLALSDTSMRDTTERLTGSRRRSQS